MLRIVYLHVYHAFNYPFFQQNIDFVLLPSGTPLCEKATQADPLVPPKELGVGCLQLLDSNAARG